MIRRRLPVLFAGLGLSIVFAALGNGVLALFCATAIVTACSMLRWRDRFRAAQCVRCFERAGRSGMYLIDFG